MSAVVVGGGIAGLVAARELLQQGDDVTVLEADARLGGMVQGIDLAGIEIDSGAEAYATRTPLVRDLCDSLGLEVAAPRGRSHVFWADPPRILPLPKGLLGIPASLDDDGVTAALTDDELRRAREDLTTEVGDVGATVADVVVDRLGPAALERLVAPLARGVFSVSPERMPIEQFAPGLVDAMRREGSLIRAVAALSKDRAGTEQPLGGMHRLVDALAGSLGSNGVRVLTRSRAAGIERRGHCWIVSTVNGPIVADRVVIATPARAAARLLADVGVELRPPSTHTTRSVLLALRHDGLDRAPVGTGVLLAERPDAVVAKSLTHYSAKWPWAAQNGLHIVRLAWPHDREPETRQALADASVLLGVDLGDEQLVDHHFALWSEMPHVMTAPARDDLVDRISTVPGITVAGAWLAGNGLAAVVASAKQATT